MFGAGSLDVVRYVHPDEFAELKTRVTKGRRVAAERLGARQRRR